MKLKTRTNQPVEYEIETTTDIQHLSDSFLDNLKAGDIITKKTGNQKHAYVVSYKEEKHGICLTYCDASGYIETISYDYTNSHWVYNSTDIYHGDEKADKDYVDDELAKKANLSGASFTGAITSPSIIEDMTGYSFSKNDTWASTYTVEDIYASVVKTGNKITFVLAYFITRISDTIADYHPRIGNFNIPALIGEKIVPFTLGTYTDMVSCIASPAFSTPVNTINMYSHVRKISNTAISMTLGNANSLTLNTKFYVRNEITILLSDNIVSSGE